MPDMETELYLRKGVAFRCPDPENEGREGYIRLKVGDVDKIDANGDILRAGSVGRQKVLISPYQHGVWRGAIPIGRGVIYEKDKEILFDGNLNMELESARETWSAMKFAQDITELSFGHRVTKYDHARQPGRSGMMARNVYKTTVFEVTPGVNGAAPGTKIIEMRAEDEPEYAGPPEEPEPEPESEAEPEVVLDTAEVIQARLQMAGMTPPTGAE